MKKASIELLKKFVRSQKFTSTTDIMNSMKELFSDVPQQVMKSRTGRKTWLSSVSFAVLITYSSSSIPILFLFPSLIGSLFLLSIKNHPPVLFYHSWLIIYWLFSEANAVSYLNEKGHTVIIVTHDLEITKQCDRIIDISEKECSYFSELGQLWLKIITLTWRHPQVLVFARRYGFKSLHLHHIGDTK